MFRQMIDKKNIDRGKGHELVVLTEPNLDVFDHDEIETLKEVFELAQIDGGQTLYKKSHEEAAYKKTPAFKLITYNFAKKLNL